MIFQRNKKRSDISSKYGGGMVEKRTPAGLVADVCIHLILLFVLLACLLPMWHVLMASLSNPRWISIGRGTVGGIAWLPVGGVTFAGYELLLQEEGLYRGFINTIFYMICATAFGMLINLTAGYVMARKSKLRSVLVVFVMFTAMFNGGMMPTYSVIKGLGFTDTPWALLIPGCTNAFFIVMLSNALAAVPESTVEAAELDGAGHLRIMWQIMLPQAMTLTTVIILNSLVLQWNAWVNASLYLSNSAQQWWPLQIWIRQFIQLSDKYLGQGGVPNFDLYLLRYAVIIIGALPMLVVFPFFQKKMEKGVIAGAVKG